MNKTPEVIAMRLYELKAEISILRNNLEAEKRERKKLEKIVNWANNKGRLSEIPARLLI